MSQVMSQISEMDAIEWLETLKKLQDKLSLIWKTY